MKPFKSVAYLVSLFALVLGACDNTGSSPVPVLGPGPDPGPAPVGSATSSTTPASTPATPATTPPVVVGNHAYYVDFENGADINNGLSTTSAWKHCPGDVNATGIPRSTPLSAGDVVTFKGGVHYCGTIHLVFNGTTTMPVTYNGNSSGNWGTGKAVIDGEHLNQDARRYGFVTDTSVSNVVIRNFEVLHLGGVANLQDYTNQPLPYSPGYGVYLRDATNVEVRDCYFHELGVWANVRPASYEIGLGGFGIYAFGVDGLTVANCEFTRMEKGIRVSPGQVGQNKAARRVLITECDFHNYMRWLVEISTSADNTTLDDITVSHCRLHDFTEFDSGVWQGAGVCPHTDGIILGVSDYRNRTYGTIRLHSNHFYQNTTAGGGTAMIFSTGMGGNVQIYNNVFVNSLHGCGAIYIQDGPIPGHGDTPINFEICNNSFYDGRYAILLRTVTSGCNVGDGNITILNNAFCKAVGDAAFSVVVFDTNSAPKMVDYNCYCTPRADQLIMMRGPQGYATLADARSKWGWETHGMVADPRYVDVSQGVGVNSSRNNLHLTGNSPCINAGTNLSHRFTLDKDKLQRHPTQAWDIGAFKAP
ncbi:MAG: right-handed parallel beta-helix repeat-containing protein [Verrucomicrobia bacterium]|nr:right-handed parallel beta-helix repeat-containing protein [Verrucomicrobiota bacterium]